MKRAWPRPAASAPPAPAAPRPALAPSLPALALLALAAALLVPSAPGPALAGLTASAEILYLRATDGMPGYAMVDIPGNGVFDGPVARTEHGYAPGFRLGLGFEPTQSQADARLVYGHLESRIKTGAHKLPGGSLLVVQAVNFGALRAADSATATDEFILRTVDLEFGLRGKLWDKHEARIFAGPSYLNYGRGLNYTYFGGNFVAEGEPVVISMDYKAAGPRAGAEATLALSWGIAAHARGAGSFRMGQYHSSVLAVPHPNPIVQYGRREQTAHSRKAVPSLETLLGLGVDRELGTVRLQAELGYRYDAIFGLVDPPAFATASGDARQQSDFILDGFQFRFAVRF